MSAAVIVVLSALLGAVVGWAIRPLAANHQAPLRSKLPLPEVLSATLFGLGAAQYQNWRLLAFIVFLGACVALSIVDLAQYRLPNAILFPAIAVSALIITVGQVAVGEPGVILRALVGALLYSAILLVMHLMSPAGMGFGDVKLALLLGMFVGWVSLSRLEAVRAVMIALFIGSALGVVLGGGRVLVSRFGGKFLPDPEEGSAGDGWRRTTFPFGPPLMAGAIIVALYPATLLG